MGFVGVVFMLSQPLHISVAADNLNVTIFLKYFFSGFKYTIRAIILSI
jgi:hypothetical protein